MRPLRIYLRHNCSLCEQMVQELAPFQEEIGFELQAVDVDSSSALQRAYGERVPVLVGEQGEICHFFLDPEPLRRYFASL